MNGAAPETPLCVQVRIKRLVVLHKQIVMVYEGLWCRYCARKTVYEETGFALRGFVGKMILCLIALDYVVISACCGADAEGQVVIANCSVHLRGTQEERVLFRDT